VDRRLKNVLWVSTLVVVGLTSASCDNDTTAPDGDAIVIGGLFSITGNWATLGVASKAAMEIGIEDVNPIQVATLSYGVGNWYLLRGDTTRARVVPALGPIRRLACIRIHHV